MGSVGDSYDNALAETINGLHKAEVFHRRGLWRSFDAMIYATLEWVDWFNHRLLLKPIGNIPPAEAEATYYAMLDETPLLRNSNQIGSSSAAAAHTDLGPATASRSMKPTRGNDQGTPNNRFVS